MITFVGFLFLFHRPLTQTTEQLIGDDCQRLAEIFQITRNYCSFVTIPKDDNFFRSELGSDEEAGGDESEWDAEHAQTWIFPNATEIYIYLGRHLLVYSLIRKALVTYFRIWTDTNIQQFRQAYLAGPIGIDNGFDLFSS